MAPPDERVLVGWKEYLDLPELGIFRLKAKMDTGARTSTLHVDSITPVEELPGGVQIVEIVVSPSRRRPDWKVVSRARVLRHVRVVDSGGHPEVRPLVETELALGPVRKRILVTLTDRSGMLFRMIVGRKALEEDFRVDVAQKYLLRKWHPRRRTARGTPPEAERESFGE